MPQRFADDASLVLIGMRCVGKSSLASIAAKTFQWRVVDEKMEFCRTTGCSVGEYIAKHGLAAFHARSAEVLAAVLSENTRSRIIVCSSSCIEKPAGRQLLHKYLPILPIVHVMRDGDVLHANLHDKWQGNVMGILRSKEPVYRDCSNLTFFNTDDIGVNPTASSSPAGLLNAVTSPFNKPTSRSISLKRVERDFLRFLRNVYGPGNRLTMDPSGADTLNYALDLQFLDLKRCGFDLEELACCADVLHFDTNTLLRGYFDSEPPQTWWEYLVYQFAYLRRNTSQPILYHTGTPLESRAQDLGIDYFDLVRLGLRLGLELVTIGLNQDFDQIQSLVQQKGHCKIVGWFHDPDPIASGGWMSPTRFSLHQAAIKVDCDILHVTQPATQLSDNAMSQCFAEAIRETGGLMVSAYNTGRLGKLSQCLNTSLTLVRHPDIAKGDTESITIAQSQMARFSAFANENLNFFVMGAQVQWSVASMLHNCAFEAYGMPHNHTIKQSDTFSTLEALMESHHFGGVSFSAPFKTSVIPRLHSMSAEARAIGAVNVVLPLRSWNNTLDAGDLPLGDHRNRAGPVIGIHGENNDWIGMQRCALRYLSPANAISPISTALIMGAGGMARAAVYAMIRSGIRRIYIYNRTHQHAEELVRHFESQVNTGNPLEDTEMDLDGKESHHKRPSAQLKITTLKNPDDPWPSGVRLPTIVVNCTPVLRNSMKLVVPSPPAHINSDTSPRDCNTKNKNNNADDAPALCPVVSPPTPWLQSPTGGVYLELAYNTITSSPELVRICEGKENKGGWIGVSGLEIFLEVASAQFEFWTGRRAPQYLMKRKIDEWFRRRQEIGEEGGV